MSPLRVVPQTQSRSITFSNHGYADQTVHVTEPGVDGHATGAFSIDFSGYPDGPIPAETGLRDNFLDDPRNEDEMGIRDGKLAIVEFRGPDQAFYDDNAGGGRRGYAWRNTSTLTDDVAGLVEIPPGSGAVLHINNDYAGSEYVGISVWFVPAPFSWTELGLIGRNQEDFSYLDLLPATTDPEPGDEVWIRSVDGRVSLEVNGETVCGPCDIPAGLVGSAIHGVQMDVSADEHEGVGFTEGVTVVANSDPLTERPAPTAAAIGTAVETASATTINVPYPSGIAAGHGLYCVVATKNGGTISASGWTDVNAGFGVTASIGIRVLRKTAVGSESGSLTVTKNTAGVMAGVMIRVTGDYPTAQLAGQGNSSSSTSLPSIPLQVFGPNRGAIWLAATSIDTDITAPSGFFPMSFGVTGGQAIRLTVAGVGLSDHPDFPDPPIFNAYASSHFPAQTGSCASAATSAAGTLIVHPAVAT